MTITTSVITGLLATSISMAPNGHPGGQDLFSEDGPLPLRVASEYQRAAVQPITSDEQTTSEVQALADEMSEAQASLAVGESQALSVPGAGSVLLTMTGSGLSVSAPLSPTLVKSGAALGFCHTAAMAAVYGIGSAVFAAAALTGGITVMGVFVSSYAAGSMSAALAAGSGVSTLVSVYIC